MNTYMEILRQYDLKATPQRLAILNIVSTSGHINIDELYEEIKKQFHSISLATIYKNINTMTENKLLLEVKLPNSKSVYEVVKSRHAHLSCEICGDIQDMSIDAEKIFKEISNEYSFKINNTDVIISGICKSCSK
ncbi:MAG: Fur family transcriptional regulator [Arcobacteraceae bacterium]